MGALKTWRAAAAYPQLVATVGGAAGQMAVVDARRAGGGCEGVAIARVRAASRGRRARDAPLVAAVAAV